MVEYESLDEVPPTLPGQEEPVTIRSERLCVAPASHADVVTAALAMMRGKLSRKKRLSNAELDVYVAMKKAGLM